MECRTANKKVVWHCIKSSKKGKKFCSESKGMHEEVIEAAFVKVFNEMCANSRDIIEEFIKNVEQTLSNSTAKKELAAINREFVKVEERIQKLVDLHLDGLLDRKTYEDKFKILKQERNNIQAELNRLELSASDEKDMKEHLRDSRKYFDVNKPLKKFDADVFNAIVDHIILGGIDDEGNKDPHLLTFIFKTGPKSKISMSKPKRGSTKNKPFENGEDVRSSTPSDKCGDSGKTS